MKKLLLILFVLYSLIGHSQQEDQFYRIIDWEFVPGGLIQVNDSTYTIDAIPIDFSNPGAITRDIGNYVVDFVGSRFKVTGSTATTLTVVDQYGTGFGPQVNQSARCYQSVYNGEVPYVGSVDYSRLDLSTRWKLNGADNELLAREIKNIVAPTAGVVLEFTDPSTDEATSTAVIDTATGVIITLTTTGNSQTLQPPTNADAGKTFYVVNALASGSNIITINGVILDAGEFLHFTWDGAAWTGVSGEQAPTFFYNDNAYTIEAGDILHLKSATSIGGVLYPTYEYADGSQPELTQGTLVVAKEQILPNSFGRFTRFGDVFGTDNSSLIAGSQIWLSATNPGKPTSIKPEFPNYSISIGGAYNDLAAPNGRIFVSITKDIYDIYNDAWDGSFIETMTGAVTSDGVTITFSVENIDNTRDLIANFSDGFYRFDCSPTPQSIVLSAGTDTDPQINYVYLPKSTKTITVSTAGWPTGTEHVKIADISVFSATRTQTDGAFVFRLWNDHVKDEDDNGHLLHISENIRRDPAQHISGVEGTVTVTGGTTVDYSNTGGKISQLHEQDASAINTATGDHVYFVNDFTTAFRRTTDLETQTTDANGNSYNNTSYSWVIIYVQNKGGTPPQILINVPTGTYTKTDPDLAVNDASNFSVYDIPDDAQGKAIGIIRATFVNNNGVISLYDTEDLRKKSLDAVVGGGGAGGGGITTLLGATDYPNSYTTHANKIVKVGSGETATEFSLATISDAGTVNIPTGQTYQINGTDLATGDLTDDGTYMDNATHNAAGLTGQYVSTDATQTITGDLTLSGINEFTEYVEISGADNYLLLNGGNYVKFVNRASAPTGQTSSIGDLWMSSADKKIYFTNDATTYDLTSGQIDYVSDVTLLNNTMTFTGIGNAFNAGVSNVANIIANNSFSGQNTFTDNLEISGGNYLLLNSGGYVKFINRASAPTGQTSSMGDLWMSSADGKIYFTNSSTTYDLTASGGGGAPTDATYITQTANATLTNEQALSALGTGFMKSTTGTGVVSTQSSISLSSDVSGNLPVTNLNSGTGASATTFWRGDGTWTVPFTLTTSGTSGSATFSGGVLNIPVYSGGGGGDVSKVGTPVNKQVGVWTGDGTLAGYSGLEWDNSTITLDITGHISMTGDLEVGIIDGERLIVHEMATPTTPPASHGTYYFKTDGKPYALNDAGTEYDLTASGGGSSSGSSGSIQLSDGTGGFTSQTNLDYISGVFDIANAAGTSGSGRLDVGSMTVLENSVLGTPASGRGKYGAKTDGKPYFVNDAGTEYDLSGGGGSSDSRQTLTSSSSITFDYDNGNYATLAIATNATLTFQDVPDLGKGTIVITQDATSSRVVTFSENITGVTAIEYSGELKNIHGAINGSGTEVTRVKYERINDKLHLDIIWDGQ